MNLNEALEWIILGLFLVVSVQCELKVVWPLATRHLHEESGGLQLSFIRCGYWVAVAVIFNLLVYALTDGESAESWFSGYVLEYTLSVDNLFIFQMMFRMYKTPVSQIDKALLYGIWAAAGLRLVFFIIGTSLFEWISWIKYPFGLLLFATAWKTANSNPQSSSGSSTPTSLEEENSNSQLAAFCGKYFPVSTRYDKSGNFFQHANSPDMLGVMPEEGAGLKVTMLGLVVLALAVVDVVFALDAVAAKVTQTSNLFINFTSSLFAMMSFRALYHIIAELTVTFVLLKYGIAIVLAYVGVELILSNWIKIPNQFSCAVILSVCVFSIIGSLLYAKFRPEPTSKGYSIEMSTAANPFGLEEEEDFSPAHA